MLGFVIPTSTQRPSPEGWTVAPGWRRAFQELSGWGRGVQSRFFFSSSSFWGGGAVGGNRFFHIKIHLFCFLTLACHVTWLGHRRHIWSLHLEVHSTHKIAHLNHLKRHVTRVTNGISGGLVKGAPWPTGHLGTAVRQSFCFSGICVLFRGDGAHPARGWT